MSVTRAEIHELAREHRRLRLTRGARTDEDLVPRQRVPDYRTRLDSRIGRCPGCDGWCWDGHCPRCFTRGTKHVDNMCTGGQKWDLTCENGGTEKAGPGSASDAIPSPRREEMTLLPYAPFYPAGAA